MLDGVPRLLLLLIQYWFGRWMGRIPECIRHDVLKAQLFIVCLLFPDLIQYRTDIGHDGHLIRYDMRRDTVPFDCNQMGQCDCWDHDDLSRRSLQLLPIQRNCVPLFRVGGSRSSINIIIST